MIYQDEYVACFLDAFPLALGHILVVPTIEVDHFYDVPEPYSTAVHNASKKVAIALKQATDATRI
jgi:histidine triad (HIT) family protein